MARARGVPEAVTTLYPPVPGILSCHGQDQPINGRHIRSGCNLCLEAGDVGRPLLSLISTGRRGHRPTTRVESPPRTATLCHARAPSRLKHHGRASSRSWAPLRGPPTRRCVAVRLASLPFELRILPTQPSSARSPNPLGPRRPVRQVPHGVSSGRVAIVQNCAGRGGTTQDETPLLQRIRR